MKKMIPVRNNIIFKFVEATSVGRFINSTDSNIIISSQDLNQSGVPRWAEVKEVGPLVSEEIKPGIFILIEAGMWTPGFVIDDITYWKTDDKKILAVSESPSSTY